MSQKRLPNILKSILRIILLILIALVLLFFGLTRTQVGRDGIRNQLVARFNEQFEGTLQIAQLSGNLIQTFYVSDIQILDPIGRAVITIDSVIARPDWRSLFRSTLSTRYVTLLRPKITLFRDQDDEWNIARTFRRLADGANGSTWSFSAATIELVDGELKTRSINVPVPVRDSLIFDYSDMEINDIQAQAVLEMNGDVRHLDMRQFSASMPDPGMRLASLRGQFVHDAEGYSMNEIECALDRSRINLTAFLGPVQTQEDSTVTDVFVDIDVDRSVLSLDELAVLLPRSPFSSDVGLSARIRGSLSQLEIENLTVEKGTSGLTAEGTIAGYPDSLHHEIVFSPGTLSTDDISLLLPYQYVPDIGEIQFEGRTQGNVVLSDTMSTPHMASETSLSLKSNAGNITSQLSLFFTPDQPLRYELEGSSLLLDLGQITGDESFSSRFNGNFAINGEGFKPETADVSMNVDLSLSAFAGRLIDSLHVGLSGVQGQWAGRAFLGQQQSVLFLTTDLNLDGEQPALRLDATARRLDFGKVLLNDSLNTSISGHLSVRGTGSNWADIEGQADLSLDSSFVSLNRDVRTMAPSQSRLELVQAGNDTPRLDLTGDMAELHVRGDVAIPSVLALSRYWYHNVSTAVLKEINKPYSSSVAYIDPPPPETSVTDTVTTAVLRSELMTQLDRADIDRMSLETHLQVYRSDILSAMIPTWPRLATNLQLDLNVSADQESFSIESTMTGDSLYVDVIRADSFLVDMHAAGQVNTPIEENLTFQLTSDAGFFQSFGARFKSAGLSVQYREKQAHFDIAAVENGPTGPFHISGRLDITPQYNRLTFSDIYIAATDYEWTFPEDINPLYFPVDFYQNAIVVAGLFLENRSAESEGKQRISAEGTLSRSPGDSMTVALDYIRLRQISDFFSFRRPLGGTLNGQIALTDAFINPHVTGALHVSNLTLENHLLGDLTVSSRFEPGANDAVLDLHLAPLISSTSLPLLQDTEEPILIEDSDVRVEGTFRLPEYTSGGEVRYPGQINLNLVADRADAFFLEYIFDNIVTNVDGYFSGFGSITGSFTRPVFDVNFDLYDGDFEIPMFNLAYQIEGPVHVGRESIYLDGVRLRDAGGGGMQVEGDILFNDYRFFSFDLTGEMDDLQIMNMLTSRDLPFYGQIWTSGTTTLTGPLHNATLRSENGVTSPESMVLIPLVESGSVLDPGFIVFADSTGQIPDLSQLTRRTSLLARRAAGERTFLEGLDMDLNIFAPPGSTVQLVIDPLLGDIINAVGSGQIQIQRNEGEFSTFGTLEVTSGDYLFTAGDVFFRRFLIDNGVIVWDGDPLNPVLDINASYRTRASSAGLNLAIDEHTLIPLIVHLHVTDRVESPAVDLRLEIERDDRNIISGYEGLEAALNQPERATEYATSVLLTNSFLLTTALTSESEITTSGNQLAFNSLSQLVASQLNRYLNQAIPNLDLNLGVQQGDQTQDLGVTYGIALRFLDERLIIRGQGVYQNTPTQGTQQNWLDEFVVEVRLTPDVSVEVFYRRDNDLLTTETFTNTTGAGLSYETQFPTWRRLFNRLFGWIKL